MAGPVQQHVDNAAGAAGAATTAAGTYITWVEQANAIVDLLAGGAAFVAAVFTCVWTYYKIKEMRGNGGQ